MLRKMTVGDKEEVKMKRKVLMVIAPNNFRDEELDKPREILKSRGVEVKVASTSTDKAKGILGQVVKPDLSLDDVSVADFDAVVFVGGGGAAQYFDDPVVLEITKEAYETGKIVGAICIAPTILANAGILNGRRATCFSSEVGKLENKGAIYTGKGVEEDDNIITAEGPDVAADFGEVLVEALT